MLLATGKEIVRSVRSTSKDPSSEGAVFRGDITSLTLTDFMGVQGSLTFPLGDLQEGIWLVEGANGSGKSTMLEAISWCLFGEFLRSDMVKDFAINEHSKECKVRVEFANGYIIERQRRKGKPDILKTFRQEIVDGETKQVYLSEFEKGELKNTQAHLEQLMGMNYQTFSKSIVLGQNIVSNFLSGGKDQRRAIIEETLGLERFNNFHDEAKNQRKDLEKEMEVVSRMQKEVEEQLEGLKADSDESLDELYAQKLQHKNSIEEETKEMKVNSQRELEEVESSLPALQEELSTLSQQDNTKPQKDQISLLKKLIEEINGLYSVVSQLSQKEAECPTCHQPLDQQHRQDILHRSLSSLKEIIDKFSPQVPVTLSLPSSPSLPSLVETLNQLLSELNQTTKTMETELNLSLQTLQALQQKISSLEMRRLQLQNSQLRQSNSLQQTLSQLERELLEIENVRQQQISRKETIEQLEEKVNLYTNDFSQLQEKFQLYRFWEITFDKQR